MTSTTTVTARSLAVEVLVRVWESDAYAAPTLDAALRRAPALDPRDKGLATELVYGVLRTASYLDGRIKKHALNDRWRNKHAVRATLLVAAYSLAFLDRIPDHAAVSEAVGSIKRGPDQQMAGFANAVLRKVAAEPRKTPLLEAAARSVPRWLNRELTKALGQKDAAHYLGQLDAPPLCLWLTEEGTRDPWIAQLKEAAPTARFEPGTSSPRSIRAWGTGDFKRLPGAGVNWVVQEEGAQVIALSLGTRAGEQVLDACAGRGNKTLVLADAVGTDGAVDSADVHASKLERLRAGPAGRHVRHTFAVDWTKGRGTVTETYDRVLVDAPCTGTGTLRRRPEITSRLAASDVTRLAALQLSILQGVLPLVRPGGRLVYAVCSVLHEECEDVVNAIGDELEPAPFDSDLPVLAGHTQLRLLPHEHGTDGYFLASFRRAL